MRRRHLEANEGLVHVTHASADTNSVFQFAGVFGRALAPIMGDQLGPLTRTRTPVMAFTVCGP